MKLITNNRPSSHSIEPLKTSRKFNTKKITNEEAQRCEITYDPNRFHKNDYISLQKWF